MRKYLLLLLVSAWAGCPNPPEQPDCTSDCPDAGMDPDTGADPDAEICASACAVGARSCQESGVSICEMNEAGCASWSTPTACAPEETCSLGECNRTCVDECAAEETRCDAANGVQICGQADEDSCLEWQQPIDCDQGLVCSNGRCAESCTSECTATNVRCRDGGIARCIDDNLDGCFEWVAEVACSETETCEGIEGRAGESGVAHCEPRESCTDECTANSCANNTFTACGNFDLDPCLEPSPGIACAAPNRCEVGVCDLAANGCVTSPRSCNSPDGPTCISNSTQRIYEANGVCNPADGRCQYPYRELPCRSCNADSVECGDLCAGVTCPALPNVEARNQACYVQNSGICQEGSCNFQYNNGSCDDGDACTVNDSCSSGQCSGAPMVCDRPPAATCIDGVARTYGSRGSCMSGSCRYSIESEQTCALGCAGTACRPNYVVAIDGGGSHTCAQMADGSVVCWGDNRLGQLGAGSTNPRAAIPIRVVGITNSTMISVGRQHACALLTNGVVRCWGDGFGTAPVSVPTGNFASISAGGEHTCGVLRDGTVRCWGENLDGQLGTGDLYARDYPGQVVGLTGATVVSAGGYHTCAVVGSDRTVMCWGRGHEGQLGNGRSGNEPGSGWFYRERTPVAVPNLQGIEALVSGNGSLVGRSEHTCARDNNPQNPMHCWGSNSARQLGSWEGAFSTSPVTSLARGANGLAAGYESTCSLDGRVLKCWGDHEEERNVNIPGRGEIQAIGSGSYHSCAIHRTDTGDTNVWCWGTGTQGQLGNGAYQSQATPVMVSFPIW